LGDLSYHHPDPMGFEPQKLERFVDNGKFDPILE
jgi:hypothetical protein